MLCGRNNYKYNYKSQSRGKVFYKIFRYDARYTSSSKTLQYNTRFLPLSFESFNKANIAATIIRIISICHFLFTMSRIVLLCYCWICLQCHLVSTRIPYIISGVYEPELWFLKTVLVPEIFDGLNFPFIDFLNLKYDGNVSYITQIVHSTGFLF